MILILIALNYVLASPKWVKQPMDITAVIGEALGVNCVASGSPNPRISWKKYSGIISYI